MLTINSGRATAIRAILIAFLLQLGVTYTCHAADDITPVDALRAAIASLNQGKFDQAADHLFSYLSLVKGSKMDRVVKKAQEIRYKLATILISIDRKEDAVSVLNDYIENQPAVHIRRARKMLAACYFEAKDYKECVPAVTNALYYNNYAVEFNLEKGSLAAQEENVFGEEDEPDLPYSEDELAMLQFTMAESYFNLAKQEDIPEEKSKSLYAACIDPFMYVIDHAADEQRRGYSIMQVINAQIELKEFDNIAVLVAALYKTPARYDIRVNLALFNAADALLDAGEYDAALPLYRMILPRDELVEYQENKLAKMREDAGLPPQLGEKLTEGEMLLFGASDDERSLKDEVKNSGALVKIVSDEEETSPEEKVPQDIVELSSLLNTLKGMSPYENYVNFQMAYLYNTVERYWESVKFYDLVAAAKESGEIGERSAYESVKVLIENLGEVEDAQTRALSFLEDHQSGVYPRLVAYVLTSQYQHEKQWQSIRNLRPYIDSFEVTGNVRESQYDSELYFMQGVAELMSQQYSNAVVQFQYVLDKFPGTRQQGNSLFWQGFAYLCLDQHPDAYKCFERYTRDFANLPPAESMLDEAYYQGGICLFGMDRLDEAKERFSYVIDTFGTNSPVYPDSCNMRGDIYGAEGGQMLDAAVTDYKNAFNNATRASQATYATFKMCDIYKADEHYYGPDYVIEQVNLYLAKWGDSGADIAKALFYLGRTKIQQGLYEQAAESYMEAIIDYGGDLRQDGVDLMIPELVKIGKAFLTEEQLETIKARLSIALDKTDNEVLKLRLRVLLAKFDDTELELGKELLKELPNLDNASPPVLAAICDASFALNDFSRAEDLLRIFKYNFEDSNYMRSAYKLRATGQFDKGDLDGAMETIADAQAEYGTERTVAWAQLMKAQILLDQSLGYSGNEPLTQEQLDEESQNQLKIAQDQYKATTEELTKAQTNEDQKNIDRLLGEQGQLGERVSELQRAVAGSLGDRAVRSLLAKCKIDNAREENKNVMGVSVWRGEPFAQATYQLGEVEEAAGNLLDAHGYFQRVYFQYKGLGEWGAKGYIAAASVLKKLSEEPGLAAKEQAKYEKARINTLKAMLLDSYANKLPQADTAREILGSAAVAELESIIASGTQTNIVVTVEAEDKDNPPPKKGASVTTQEGA